MTSSRPYLLRAIYDWIVDNQLTPHVAVNAHGDGVSVPQEYVQDGQITLNITPGAVRNLVMDNVELSFSARFRGVPMDVRVPVESILGIYARENGQGMMFADEGGQPPDPEDGGTGGTKPRKAPPPKSSGKPSLRIVK